MIIIFYRGNNWYYSLWESIKNGDKGSLWIIGVIFRGCGCWWSFCYIYDWIVRGGNYELF